MSEFVTSDGVKLHYELRGQGRPLLVCQGGPNATYRHLPEHLLEIESDFRLVYSDYRGSGASASAPVETYTVERLADDLDELCTHLGLDQVDVLAHSMGGFVALNLALRHPSRCRSLALLAATPVGRIWKLAPVTALALGPLRIAKLLVRTLIYFGWWWWLRDSPERTKARYAMIMSMQEPRRRAQGLYREEAQGFVLNDNAPVLERATYHTDLTSSLREIRCPALVLYGTRDAVFVAGALFLAWGLPNARVAPLRGLSHLPYLEDRPQTIGAIRAFLSEAC